MSRKNTSRQASSGPVKSSLFSWAFVLVVVGICLAVLQLALTPTETSQSRGDVDPAELVFNWVPPDMNSATRFLLGHSTAAGTMQRLNNATLEMWKRLDGPAKQCGARRRQSHAAAGGMCFRETFIGYHARFLSTPLTLLHALEKLYGHAAVRNWTQPLDIHLHEWVRVERLLLMHVVDTSDVCGRKIAQSNQKCVGFDVLCRLQTLRLLSA